MAMPVPMKQMVQTDPREELQKRIQDAPTATRRRCSPRMNYCSSCTTQERSMYCVARSARATCWWSIVSLVTAPESITALRNVILIGKVLGSINPEVFHAVLEGIPQATAQVPGAKPPSLFALGRRIASQDARRGLAAAVSVMEVVGRGLAKESASRKRKKRYVGTR
jgi:hypothetical protein